MPIDIGTSTALTVVPKPQPASLVCPTCKEETGTKKEDVLDKLIDSDFCCPFCGSVVFSCRPEKNNYAYAAGGAWTRGEYDYD